MGNILGLRLSQRWLKTVLVFWKVTKRNICPLHADILLSLLDPEDGSDMVFGKFGWLSLDYRVLYSRRRNVLYESWSINVFPVVA
jgi:hypothetical protein